MRQTPEFSRILYQRDPLAEDFYREIKKIPVLSYEQERKLLEKASRGDHTAKSVLVVSNIRFVFKTAQSFYKGAVFSGRPGVGSTITFSDLVQEGTVALFEAVDYFNPQEHSTTFLTYAAWGIRQRMQKYLDEQGWPVKFPAEERKAVFLNLEKALNPEDSSGAPLEELVASTEVPSSEKEELMGTILAPLREKLHNLMAKAGLDSREKFVLLLRYGFYLEGRLTLEQIGQMLNLTKERVGQIEKRALKQIRGKVTRYEKRQIYELLWQLQQIREGFRYLIGGGLDEGEEGS